MMLAEFQARGVLNDINFLYMPIDFRYQCNVGYCFVNVTSEPGVARVYKAFEHVVFKQVPTEKKTIICVGNLQGLDANIETCRNHAVMELPEQYQPLILDNGLKVPFPPPNKPRGRMPRGKKGVSTRTVGTHVYRSRLGSHLLGDEVIQSI